MQRLSTLWTGVGSATVVCVGAALGGLGLVDARSMLVIMLVPQPFLLAWGDWPGMSSDA